MAIGLGAGGNALGRATATAGTVINAVVPPRRNSFGRVSTIRYTAAGTAHTLTALRSLGRTRASGAGAAGQAVVNLVANPGPAGNALAANDWVAIREVDGVTRVYLVQSISTLAVTLSTNLVAGVNTTSDVWMFGVAADTDPLWGTAHPGLTMPASATTNLVDNGDGVVASNRPDEPILLQSNNAAAAGTLELVSFTYTQF